MTESPKLLDRVRERIRLKHHSVRTGEVYVQWVKRFVLHHGKRHPAQMGAAEVEAFLTHLAAVGRVSTATRNQARTAPLFLYKEVQGSALPCFVLAEGQGQRRCARGGKFGPAPYDFVDGRARPPPPAGEGPAVPFPAANASGI